MQEVTTTAVSFPSSETKDVLTEILREGAQTLLVQAIEAEVADWIDRHTHFTDDKGHRLVVRNGRLPKRQITTGVGQVEIQQPRVHDRRGEEATEKFTSKILPPYLAEDQVHRRIDSLAVSQRDQHGRLRRGAAVDPGQGRTGAVGLDDYPSEKHLGRTTTATGRSVP